LREQSENVYENKESRSRGVEQSRSSEVEPGSQAVGCRRFVTLQLWTLDFSTRTFTIEPGMSMKTKERCGKLRGGPIVLSDHPMARSPDLLGTMAHFPESQVFQMPHCRVLRRARRQFVQRPRGLLDLGGCEMSLKARAGYCRSVLRQRTGEAGSPLASDCGDGLARELQFLFWILGTVSRTLCRSQAHASQIPQVQSRTV